MQVGPTVQNTKNYSSMSNLEPAQKRSVEPGRKSNVLSDDSVIKLVPDLANIPDARTSVLRLRDIQKEHDIIYGEYVRERQLLEQRYKTRFGPLYVLRHQELSSSPIDDFWPRVLENCELFRENVTERDAVALRYLYNLTCDTVTETPDIANSSNSKNGANVNAQKDGETGSEGSQTAAESLPVGSFTLRFYFKENPFFDNDVLVKTYVMQEDNFEDLAEARGCKIEWKRNMDLTVRLLKKKGRNGRAMIKKQAVDSFFNFFSPPGEMLKNGPEADPSLIDDFEDVMSADFEIGDCIRSDLIPRAFYYFLNIAESDYDSEESEDDGEDESEDEDEGEEDNEEEEEAEDDSEEGKKVVDRETKIILDKDDNCEKKMNIDNEDGKPGENGFEKSKVENSLRRKL